MILKTKINQTIQNTKMKYIFVGVLMLVGLILVAIFVGFSVSLKENELRHGVEDQLREIVQEKIQFVENFLDSTYIAFDGVSNDELFLRFSLLSPGDELYEETREELQNWFDISGLFGVGISNDRGVIVIANRRQFIGEDFSDTILTRTIIEYGEAYSIYPEKGDLEFGLGYGEVIKDPETGRFLATWGISIPIINDFKDFGRVDNLGDTTDAYIVNNKSVLLTPSRFIQGENKGALTKVINTENVKSCLNLLSDIVPVDHQGILEYVNYRGEEVIGVYRYFSDPRWCVLVEVNRDEVLGSSVVYVVGQFLMGLLVLILLTTAGFILSGILSKRVKDEEIGY